MANNDDLRKQMIQTTTEQLEELEKGIVLASIEIDKMQAMPDCNLTVSAQIRLRRTQLEAEYEQMRSRLSDLRAGNLPSVDKARAHILKARNSLREAKERADNLKSKQEEANDGLYEPESDDE